MENKRIIVLIVLGLIVISGLVFALRYSNPSRIAPSAPVAENVSNMQTPPPYVPKDGAVQPFTALEKQADVIIDITTVGFSPDKLTLRKGQSVIWTSRDQSNLHQMMATGAKKYPEKGDCGTVLDLCKPLKLGESWRITFNDVGTWTYADKLHPQFTGTIIVE